MNKFDIVDLPRWELAVIKLSLLKDKEFRDITQSIKKNFEVKNENRK